jgi:hypothetical protein
MSHGAKSGKNKTEIQKYDFACIVTLKLLKIGNSLSKTDKERCMLNVIKDSMKSAILCISVENASFMCNISSISIKTNLRAG